MWARSSYMKSGGVAAVAALVAISLGAVWFVQREYAAAQRREAAVAQRLTSVESRQVATQTEIRVVREAPAVAPPGRALPEAPTAVVEEQAPSSPPKNLTEEDWA